MKPHISLQQCQQSAYDSCKIQKTEEILQPHASAKGTELFYERAGVQTPVDWFPDGTSR